MRRLGLPFSLALLAGGCGPAPITPDDMAVTAVKFSDVKKNVFVVSCAISSSCHDNVGMQGGLDLKTDPYKALVNVPAVWPQASQAKFVEVSPGSLDKSFLWTKVNIPAGTSTKYGSSMPQTGQALGADQMALIKNWILGGAKND